MSQTDLEKQADRADNIADQTVDAEMKKTLRDAAREYRQKTKEQAFDPKEKWKLPKDIS